MARNQAGAQQAAPQEQAGKKRKSLILISVGLVALLLSAGGLTYALLSGTEDGEVAAPKEAVRQPALYHSLEPAFTVNYASTLR